jgi:phage shock protein PspC (stress-responsive transcriptional regulator)
MIAGVARGLATRFGLPIAAVRLVFLLSVLLGGWGILVYVALWIAMPLDPVPLQGTPPVAAEPQPRGAA